VIFSSVTTVRAQAKKATPSGSTTTTGNSSWDQAIAVLQAQVDQQAALIAQLQSALAGETTARQTTGTELQNAINSEVVARQAAVSAEAAARQQGDAPVAALQGGLNAEVTARQQGDANTLAAAKQYTDAALGTETASHIALQNNINNEAAARQALPFEIR